MSNIKKWIDSLNPNKCSFIIPTTFSDLRKNYLSHNLLSIQNNIVEQLTEYSNIEYEIIIVFDGCNDKTEITKFLSTFSSLNIRPIFLHEKSGTVTIPRNIVISHATGKIIIPTDDDCLIEDIKIELIYKIINTTEPIYFVYGDRFEYLRNDHGDHVYIRRFSSKEYVDRGDPGLDNGQFIYSADIYEKIQPIFAVNACDWELYKNVKNHYEMVYLPYYVCSYIWHTENISRLPKNKRVDPLAILNKYLPYFAENEYTNACKNLLNNQSI